MPDMEAIACEVTALEALGSPRAVAAHLRKRGITGLRGDSFRCPLAVYLSDVTGTRVITGCSDCVANDRDEPDDRYSVAVPFGPVLVLFVCAFDSGAFPELNAQAQAHPSTQPKTA